MGVQPMSPHYDPIHEAREKSGDELTVDDLLDTDGDRAGYYDGEKKAEPSTLRAQVLLAEALYAIGPQTFDDNAKWDAVNAILGAMKSIDGASGTPTRFIFEDEEVTETPEWADEPITYTATNIAAER